MSRPLILDLFCKEGGAGTGYAKAGFGVVGVDIAPQPRYPYAFSKCDALSALADTVFMAQFDAVHASPPCQAHSALAASNPHIKHADLIPQTRKLLQAWGGPYVIENVEGAPLVDPITLCGSMFNLGAGGYQLRRHRLFESNIPLKEPECRHDDRPVIGVYGNKARCRRRGGDIPAMGTNLPKALGEKAMGIDWMTIAGLSEAIPPAYTRFLGEQLLEALDRSEVAA